jgi:hypothetical protein
MISQGLKSPLHLISFCFFVAILIVNVNDSCVSFDFRALTFDEVNVIATAIPKRKNRMIRTKKSSHCFFFYFVDWNGVNVVFRNVILNVASRNTL